MNDPRTFSQWVAVALIVEVVANTDLCSTDPVRAAVPAVGDGHKGDIVDISQVDPPPGVDLSSGVAAGPL